MINPIKPKMA